MQHSSFTNSTEKHNHSLRTLNLFREYDDFMESIGSVLDFNPGKDFVDSVWWVSQTVRGEPHIPLNIKCTAVSSVPPPIKKKNLSFVDEDIQTWNKTEKPFDLLWAQDVLQYLENPYTTLKNWKQLANKESMLVISVPQTVNIEYNQQEYNLLPGHLYHYTLTSLIYMLAVSGWDCKSGFFLKKPNDPWINAIVYNSDIEPMKPGSSWYEVMESNLLPDSAEKSIIKHGYVRQSDLLLTWLDKSLQSYSNI